MAEERASARTGDEGAGARTLWRSRYGHFGGAGRADEGCSRAEQEDGRVRDLPGRPARLTRRLPRQLSQGGGGGCLEPDASLVQETSRAELTRAASCLARSGWVGARQGEYRVVQ